MTPLFVIREAIADGLALRLSPDGNIRAKGDPAIIAKWLPAIKEHKPAIIDALLSDRFVVDRFVAKLIGEPTDDRITCTACRNFTHGKQCQIAYPGNPLVSAMRGYHPALPDMLQRCAGYEAKPVKGNAP